MLRKKYIKAPCYYCYFMTFIVLFVYFLLASNDGFSREIAAAEFLETNSWVAILFSSGVAIIAAVVTVATSRQTAREKNALDFEQKYKENKGMEHGMQQLSKVFNRQSSLDIKEITLKPRGELDDEEREFIKSAAFVLNEWERAANAVNHNIYDEHLLYKAYGTTVLKLYMYLSDYIDSRQKDSPRYYINFMMLVARWQVRRGREDRVNNLFIRKVEADKKRLKQSLDKMSNELNINL